MMGKQFGTPMPRQISPEAVNSATLARLSFGAEVLFWHLLAQADDQGRLTGDVLRLRHLCFGLREYVSNGDVAGWLVEVVRERLVLFYTSHGEPVLQVRSWHEFQSGQRWVYPSRWPALAGWTDLRVKLPHGRTLNGAAPEPLPSGSGAVPVSVSVPVLVAAAASADGGEAAAVIETHSRLVGRTTDGAAAYLTNLVDRYGVERVTRALTAEHTKDPTPNHLLSRMERGLKRGDEVARRTA